MERHNSCINSLAIIQYVREKAPDRLSELFKDLGPEMASVDNPQAFLSDPHNWTSSNVLIRLFDNARQITGNENVAYEIGFNSILKKRLGYIQKIFLYAFGDPSNALKQIQRVNDHFNKTKTVAIVRYSKHDAILRLTWNRDIPLSRDFCLMNRGIYTAVPMMWGLPPAKLVEKKCFFRGDDCCEYELQWEKRNFLRKAFEKVFLPWKIAKESIRELEKDKEILKRKYDQVYKLNRDLQEKINQLTTLQESSTAILSTLKLEELLDLILNRLLKVASLDRAGIFLSNPEEQTLTLIHAVGLESCIFDELRGYKISLSKTDNIIARTARLNKPLIVEDVGKMSLNPHNVILKKLKPKAFILVPLTVRDQVIGIMVGDNHTNQKFFKGLDKDFLTSFANHIAMALENANLYRKLKESEKKYRNIVENVNEGFCILNPEGNVKFTNTHIKDMFGKDLRGENIYNLADKGSRKRLLHVFKENIAGRPARDELLLKKNDGTDICVLLSSVPLKKNGEFDGCLALFTDLTEKKRMENRLLQAQKLESVGTMAGGIAHDFNNILTGILGYVMLMRQKVKDQPDLVRYLDTIQRSGNRASNLISKLLAFSRNTQPGEDQPTSINSIIEESMELLNTSMPKNITITATLAPDLPLIKCNSTQIQQTILNICLNARDAMPSGGTLDISTSLITGEELKKNYGYPAAFEKSYIKLKMTDTGTGISSENMSKIFDPFFTTKEVGKGTGLGLAMVYGIMKSNGGFVHVESQVNKGTSFYLFFPVSTEIGEAESTLNSDVRQLEGTETILVVDDEEIVRDLASEILMEHGYTVLTASDGLEALHVCEAVGRNIDLVILDIMMPRMNGIETHKRLKEFKPDMKILFCSGHGADEETVKGVIEGRLPYTPKPFTPQELLAAVRDALDPNGEPVSKAA